MANFYNHPRTRPRNYHYPRLVTSDIKRYMSVPYGSKHHLSWSTSGQLVLEFEAITTPYGLGLTGFEGFQQLIPTALTKLRSGSRQWWLCPEWSKLLGLSWEMDPANGGCAPNATVDVGCCILVTVSLVGIASNLLMTVKTGQEETIWQEKYASYGLRFGEVSLTLMMFSIRSVVCPSLTIFQMPNTGLSVREFKSCKQI